MKAPDHEVKCKASNHGDINIVVQALEVVLLLVISVLDVLKAHVEQLRTKTQKVESNNSIGILLEVKDLRQEWHDESSDVDVEPDLEEGGRLDEDVRRQGDAQGAVDPWHEGRRRSRGPWPDRQGCPVRIQSPAATGRPRPRQ